MTASDVVVPEGVDGEEPTRALAREERREAMQAWLLLSLAGALFAVLLLCTIATIRISFGVKNAEWTSWTLSNYAALVDAGYAGTFAETIGLAFLSAILASVIAFPIALYMARTSSPARRRFVFICVLLPMLVSLLVQSYGWIALLGPNGLFANVFRGIGLPPPPMLFNETGVLLGLVQTSIPLAVLPAANVLGTIPPSLEEAAGVLGASRLVVYREIILPLAWPGIFNGAVLVFAFNTGAFAVPLLLGGLKVTTIALLIRDQMGTLLNWPMGTALSVVLIALVMGVLLLRRFAQGIEQREGQ